MKNKLISYSVVILSVFSYLVGLLLSVLIERNANYIIVAILIFLGVMAAAVAIVFQEYRLQTAKQAEIDYWRRKYKQRTSIRASLHLLLEITAKWLVPLEAQARTCIFRYDTETEELYMYVGSKGYQRREKRLRFARFQGVVGHIFAFHRDGEFDDGFQVNLKGATETELHERWKLS